MTLDEECTHRILMFASPHREKYQYVMAQLVHQYRMKRLFDELIVYIFKKVLLLLMEEQFDDDDFEN